ncbi:MAG: WYL domain-containing protein [Cyanobacteria bacterium P01_D01_bin.1]
MVSAVKTTLERQRRQAEEWVISIGEWLLEQQVRRVVRRVYSTFWFFREVRRYGPDCEIVGPPDVRDRFIHNLKKTIEIY